MWMILQRALHGLQIRLVLKHKTMCSPWEEAAAVSLMLPLLNIQTQLLFINVTLFILTILFMREHLRTGSEGETIFSHKKKNTGEGIGYKQFCFLWWVYYFKYGAIMQENNCFTKWFCLFTTSIQQSNPPHERLSIPSELFSQSHSDYNENMTSYLHQTDPF